MTRGGSVNLIDGLHEMIATGRLTKDTIKDDFQWLLHALADAKTARDERIFQLVASTELHAQFQAMAAGAPLPWKYSPCCSEHIVDRDLGPVCKVASGSILAMILTAVNTCGGFKAVLQLQTPNEARGASRGPGGMQQA